MTTRRQFLTRALAACAAFRLGGTHAQEGPAPTRLRYPPPVQAPHAQGRYAVDLAAPGDRGLFAALDLAKAQRLRAAVTPAALLPGPTTPLWSIDHGDGAATRRNPLLRVRRGQRVVLRFENALPEESTIHWHGLLSDERNDGSGLHPVRPGDHYAYDFTVDAPAATYWYHPHPHYRTGFQITRGMAGMLLVEDDAEDALRRALGLRFGENEMPLLVQDKQMGATNTIDYEHGDDDWIGNRVFVNYVAEPRWPAARRLTRLRLLNASNSRPWRLAFQQGDASLPFTLIGTDGGFVERPTTMTEIFVSPAQRIDVLLDLTRVDDGTRIIARSLAFDPMEQDGQALPDPRLEHPGAMLMGEALELFAIDASGPAAPRAPKLPRRLATLPAVRDGRPQRTFRLHIDGSRWLINGRNHHDDHGAPRFDVRRGAKEIWEIRNDTRSMPHPMHVHGFHFRVLSRAKSPPQVRRLARGRHGLTPHDAGSLDTVLVWPGETVRIAIDFAQPYRGAQTYMFHCHNLEHEDLGLMLAFRVVDA